jgi:ribosome maturation factor RimP
MTSTDRIRPLVDSALEQLGLLVDDLTITPAGKRRVVRVAVDRVFEAVGETTQASDPLTLDEVADAARAIGLSLDDSDVMGAQPYVLEVTSPGVDRPLREPRHYRRNVGRLLSVTPADGEPVTGRIVRAGEDGVTLLVEGAETTIPYAGVSRAVVQVEFSRPAAVDDTADDLGDDEDLAGDEHDDDEDDPEEN